MSKKKNKKSSQKKLSKKPGASKAKSKKPAAKKKPVKKAAKKAVKSKAKPAPKKKIVKKAAKKPVKKAVKKPVAKKPTVKKPIAKAAPKTPVKKIAPAKVSAKIPVKTDSKKLPATNHTPKQTLKTGKTTPQPAPQKQLAAVPAGQNDKPRVVRVVKQVNKAPVTEMPRKSVIIDIKTGPEPAGRFEVEYVVHASAQILFEFLTTPSGLSEWFCDDVNIRNGIYTFKWEDNEQNARVVKLVEEKLVRFQWTDKHDNSYFEFRIERDDLTNDISLIVVDFADTPEERNSTTLLWNSQIDKLLHVLGAYF